MRPSGRGSRSRLAPRIDRAIQYVAHPDFHFFVSRDKFPGRYGHGADVALGRWHKVRLEIGGAGHAPSWTAWRHSPWRTSITPAAAAP